MANVCCNHGKNMEKTFKKSKKLGKFWNFGKNGKLQNGKTWKILEFCKNGKLKN